jgi:hypothetical protein
MNISPLKLATFPEKDDFIYKVKKNGEPVESEVTICNTFVC